MKTLLCSSAPTTEENQAPGAVTSAQELAQRFPVNATAIHNVCLQYPMRISNHMLSLIQKPGDPIWRQFIPDPDELRDKNPPDPMGEEIQSPVPNLIHRYPDRVLFLVTHRCAVYCRFCTRKRRIGRARDVSTEALDEGIRYIQRQHRIREVILSGGDPLCGSDEWLEDLLGRLRKIPHVQVLRIHTRIPVALPERVTPHLAAVLGRHHPLFVNIHVNHPAEITSESAAACGILADAGIPLGSQTVLLSGVNDDASVMERLLVELLRIRVRPYDLHHPDPVRGTGHFRVPIDVGLRILENLRGRVPGTAIPHYMVDLPGGGGKVPVTPDYAVRREGGVVTFRNYLGQIFKYPES